MMKKRANRSIRHRVNDSETRKLGVERGFDGGALVMSPLKNHAHLHGFRGREYIRCNAPLAVPRETEGVARDCVSFSHPQTRRKSHVPIT